MAVALFVGGGLRFARVMAPAREELEHLVQQIAERVGRALERMGLFAMKNIQ